MKKIIKAWIKPWVWVGLIGVGGFINDFFIGSSYNLTANEFRIALSIPCLLCILTFPWWRKPWEKYAGLKFHGFVGIHILAYMVIFLSILHFLGWVTSPVKYLYYLFAACIYFGVSLYLIINNYQEKWIELGTNERI